MQMKLHWLTCHSPPAAQFLIGHGTVLVCGLGVGHPDLGHISKLPTAQLALSVGYRMGIIMLGTSECCHDEMGWCAFSV